LDFAGIGQKHAVPASFCNHELREIQTWPSSQLGAEQPDERQEVVL